MLEQLRQRVLAANLQLPKLRLVTFTWGNASEIDRESCLVAIKPSGVEYGGMTADEIVLVDLDGIKWGERKPSSDTATHLALNPSRFRGQQNASKNGTNRRITQAF